MKALQLTLVLTCMVMAASAQNIGFQLNRGMSTICPDFSNFKSTLNQAVGFGFSRTKPLTSTVNLRTGVNFTSLRSCMSVIDATGETHLIPEKFNFIDMPLILEKEFFRYSRVSRSASHYLLYGGLNFAYLFHNKGFEDRVGQDYETRPLNVGVTTGIQWVKPIKWNTSFALGPQIQALTTGQENANLAFYAGMKLDWKFGKY